MAAKVLVNDDVDNDEGVGGLDVAVVVVEDELLLLQAAASRPPTSSRVASPRLVFSFNFGPPGQMSLRHERSRPNLTPSSDDTAL
jgi:hypothetical protein